MTSAAALAVCRALEDLSLQPGVKWPNDIVLPGGKVAGVLAETSGEALLLGVGINVLHRERDFPADLRGIATSVHMELDASCGGDPGGSSGGAVDEIEALLLKLLTHLEVVLAVNERSGPGAWLPQVWQRSIVRGRQVTVERTPGDQVSGIASGLGPIGELVLETDRGPINIANGTLIHLEEC
jgi:BirA family biotin operon repressor/biotin-[acetyl-CoA-carboxylase] ligase